MTENMRSNRYSRANYSNRHWSEKMNIQSEEKLKEEVTVMLLKSIIHCIESPDWKVVESSLNVQNDINELTRTINGKSFKIDINFENLKR